MFQILTIITYLLFDGTLLHKSSKKEGLTYTYFSFSSMIIGFKTTKVCFLSYQFMTNFCYTKYLSRRWLILSWWLPMLWHVLWVVAFAQKVLVVTWMPYNSKPPYQPTVLQDVEFAALKEREYFWKF